MAFPASANPDRRLLLRLLAILIVLKVSAAFVLLAYFQDDFSSLYGIGSSDGYNRLAKNLLAGNGLKFSPDTGPTLMREPGYPMFLAGIYAIFGYHFTLARVANLFLTAGSAFIIGTLARQVSPNNRWVYITAPLLFLLHPGVMIAELRGGVEALFIFLLLGFLLVLTKAIRTGKTGDYLLAGLALGIVSSVRSTALLFPLFLPILFFLNRDRRPLRESILALGCIYFMTALVLSPWIARNYSLVGRIVPTASVQGVAMHAGNYICTHSASGKGVQELDTEAAVIRSRLAKEQGYSFQDGYYQWFYDPRDEMAFHDFLGKQVIQQYQESPATFLKCASRNILNFWFAGKNSTATIANIFIQLPYLVLGLWGIFLAFRHADRAVFGTLVLFSAYMYAVYVPIHAQARYSIPLIPILAIFAAVPVSAFLARRAKNQVAATAIS